MNIHSQILHRSISHTNKKDLYTSILQSRINSKVPNITKFKAHQHSIQSLSFLHSNFNTLISSDSAGYIHVWNLQLQPRNIASIHLPNHPTINRYIYKTIIHNEKEFV